MPPSDLEFLAKKPNNQTNYRVFMIAIQRLGSYYRMSGTYAGHV